MSAVDWEVRHVNSLQVVPPPRVDAIVTDPDYGWDVGAGEFRLGDSAAAFESWSWRDITASLVDGGILAAIGPAPQYHRMATAIEEAGFEIVDQIAWVFNARDRGKSGGGWLLSKHDSIAVAVRAGTRSRMRPSPENAVNALWHRRAGQVEKRFGLDGGNPCPAVKPVALMRDLVRLVCSPGGLVFDPFCGSGTTGIAAVLEGRRFVGHEKNPAVADVAQRRIGYWADNATVLQEVLT